ncbi:peptide ABC transporter substrate-binding protein [Candidatus Kaiserbacteria bacterium]|nr:peptide ABC transporter substrate-binding protein [Candidatus Kaiserbacteria bacterium]
MTSPTNPSLGLLDKLLHRIEGTPPSDRLFLRVLFFLVIATGIWFALSFNDDRSAITPTRGGTITEGIVGTPRFVNPALALTRADQDVTTLVYSGLMRIDNQGNLVNDLAETIVVSDDGLTYNVVLKKDVTFHDGTPLTARDVVFTIKLIQDPDLKSPLRGNWSDVTIEEINEYELNVVLEEAYAPFIENFTFGIMPAHAWSSLPIEQLPFSQLNTEPIGSGPFRIESAKRDTSGLISNYNLVAYRQTTSDSKIDGIKLNFYQNESALLNALDARDIDATAYLSTNQIEKVLEDGYKLVEEPLPRVFGIFFNQNRSAALRDTTARKALTIALDRPALIDSALHGYGVPTASPTLLGSTTLQSNDGITDTATSTPANQAIALLKSGGWTQDSLGTWEKKINDEMVPLRITLRTSNTPLFGSLVDSVSKQWEAIGVSVTTEQFEQADLVQSVIRPRDFEALLFGLDMSRSYDLYPFWHSSQQDDPGLNIAQYANVEVDKLLETARTEAYGPQRQATLREASDIITSEHPAVFLFQPTLTYVVREDMTITPIARPGRPADRFNNITEWHTESDSLWEFFRNDM